jgi:hypothetical protein
MFRRIIETPSYVQSFCIEDQIYLLTDKKLQVYDKSSFEKVTEAQIFEKEGSSRSFIMDRQFIYCKDFVDLYLIKTESLEVATKLTLGKDLSSDICEMTMDEKNLYAGIRNGKVAKIEKRKWSNIEFFPLSGSSIKELKMRNNWIYAGNVEGQLLVIDSVSMKVEKSIQAHKKNTKSICFFDKTVATAALDKALALWNIDNLELIIKKRNVHQKMFDIGAYWDGKIITISFSCGEMKVWDETGLTEKKTIPMKSCLTGEACISGTDFFIISRAIKGIELAKLDELVG